MSLLVGIDALLDLIADIKDINCLVYSGPTDGLMTLQLWCDEVLHSELLMRAPDFYQVQVILTGAIEIEPAKDVTS